MSSLAATILLLLTVYVSRDLAPVYAPHLRAHPLGAEARAEQLAEHLTRAAELAQVEVALLAALAYDESRLDARARSPEGALGLLQLLPASRWGRGWRDACAEVTPGPARCEALNAVWGAYALRDGLRACGGSLERALGFYRAGRCLAGPRGRRTLALARWVRAQLAVVLVPAVPIQGGTKDAIVASRVGR